MLKIDTIIKVSLSSYRSGQASHNLKLVTHRNAETHIVRDEILIKTKINTFFIEEMEKKIDN
jgi:hypothetical protein